MRLSKKFVNHKNTMTSHLSPKVLIRNAIDWKYFSVYNAPGAQPGNDNWNYAFESENGIKQQALGEVRSIDNSDVLVMRGSYEYIGADSLVYVVNWEADENGFRATAPHLPQPVAIPFPEQQAAVDAQIRFAAEEDALRLRSGSLPAYADQ